MGIHTTLLLKLESRGVPTYILRLLSNELIGQYTCFRWGSTNSSIDFAIGLAHRSDPWVKPTYCTHARSIP